MNETITLREAIERLSGQGISVKWNDKDLTMEDFFYYYDAHYFKAINERLYDRIKTTEDPKHPDCLRFLADDLLNIFA